MTALPVRVRAAAGQLRATQDARLSRDVALGGARIALAWIFVYHGASTLFGAFGGAGLHQTAIFFATVAHLHPGTFFAALSGVIELSGGAAVGVGILGRLAAAGLVGDMVVAMVTVTFRNGIVSDAAGSGYELNVALAALALAVAILGTGRFSLDMASRALVARWHRPR